MSIEYLNKEAKQAHERELLNRWDWITEGLDYNEKLDTSIVLENSYFEMVNQGQLPNGWLEQNILNEGEGMLLEAPVQTGAVGSYVLPKIMFPIIRRVFPELIANKIVSVQPLTHPTGVIYYIVYTFTNHKGNIAASSEYSANPMQTSPAYASMYTSEKIGPYTLTYATGATATVAAGTDITDFVGVQYATTGMKRIELFNATTKQMLTTVLSTTETIFSSGATVSYTASSGTIIVQNAAVTAISGATVGDTLYAYFVYNQEGSTAIPEMEFSISNMSVATTERKLKVRWTKESEQDMQAYHKIDVEAELVKVASMEMNYELDREIVTFISDRVIPDLSFIHDWTNDSAGAGNNTSGNFLDRHRSLAQKIYQLQAKIAQYNRLGAATWAITSPQIAAILNMLPDYKGEIANTGNTMYDAGLLGGKLNIYVDPNRTGASANNILLGYKSENSVYGAGVVYSPYTNWMSNTVTDPNSFNSIRGFFTRYALTMVTRGQYNYASLNLLNYGI